MTLRRAAIALWGLLPPRGQELFVYLGAPHMTLGVAALVFDAQGRVLLVRHTYRRPAWGFPSGLVGRREQPDAALARELREELSVSATVGPLLFADHCLRRRHLTLYYRASIAGEPRHDVETDAHRYVTPDELPPLIGMPVQPWMRPS